MKLILSLLFAFQLVSCQNSLTDYEIKVYNLLNTLYERKPDAPYKSPDSYININHSLNNSYNNLNKDLFDDLLIELNSLNKSEFEKLTLKLYWTKNQINFPIKKFDQKQIKIENLHFVNPDLQSMEETKFISKIDAIIFKEDFVIVQISLFNSVFSIELYKNINNKYVRITGVSYPKSSKE